MELKYLLNKHEDHYLLQVAFETQADQQTLWQTIATSQGVKQWFLELSYDQDYKTLIFSMPELDFREEMAILAYQPESKVSFDWAGAQVDFAFSSADQGGRLVFAETMPFDFPNPENDMAGWLVHLTRLQAYFNGQDQPTIDAIKGPVEAALRVRLAELDT